MLTEDALRKMDEYACDETARKFTLRDIVNQLTHEYRTLQQQNSRAIHLLQKTKNNTSGIWRIEINNFLQSTQGGPSNDTANH